MVMERDGGRGAQTGRRQVSRVPLGSVAGAWAAMVIGVFAGLCHRLAESS